MIENNEFKYESFRVYRELEEGEHICIFADPAEGGDYCAAVGISKKYLDAVVVFNERMESSQFGHELYHIAKHIERRTKVWPTIGVERNTGQATIYVLVNFNYPDMYRMRVFDAMGYKESEKLGWLMTEANRRKMLDDLKLTVRQRGVKIYDREIVDQLRAFVIKKKGRAEAESGKFDDLVIALGGAYQLSILVPKKEFQDDYMDEFKKEQEKWRFK